jgi:glycosyltransferase involved in cell wall biosynthesis
MATPTFNSDAIPCSVGILTYNSEKSLERALLSLNGFQEIILVDGGSTDRTLAIGKKYGCTIIQQSNPGSPITDFALERNRALDAARFDWFFYIDSDEVVSDELRNSIRKIVTEKSPRHLVYRVRYEKTTHDLSVIYKTLRPYYQTRFFHKSSGARFVKPMHERIAFPADVSVGVIEASWYVPFDEHFSFATYRKKIHYRVSIMARRATFRGFFHFLKLAYCVPLIELAKSAFKILYLEFEHHPRRLPMKYEFYRMYSHVYLMYAYTRVHVFGFFVQDRSVSMAGKHIFYLFHGRFPSDKAAGLFAAKSCEAFGDHSMGLTLLVPRRRGVLSQDPYTHYSLRHSFLTQYLWTIDVFHIPGIRRVAFYISYVAYAFMSFFYILLYAYKKDIVYSNEVLPLLLATFVFPHTVYEVHDYPKTKKWVYGLLLRRVQFIVVTNEWKRRRLIAEFSLPTEKLFVERNGVDIKEFTIDVSKALAREKLKLEPRKPIILYTGHLYSWKGAHILAQAAESLPNARVAFVGGTEKDIALFRGLYGRIPSIQFFGHRPHDEIPLWQKAADVLVIPNTAKEDISKFYTSPMKLFEYMASDRPIVASDIPSVREIVSEADAFFTPPDDVTALTETLQYVLNHPDEAVGRARHARATVEGYSWYARAERILQQLKKIV